MAKMRTSKFGVDEELFLGNKEETQDVQETQKVQEVQKAQEVQEEQQRVQEYKKEVGSTQGKKGQKLKRINMAFSDVNHTYITFESRRRGLSATAFVNLIIAEYRAGEEKI